MPASFALPENAFNQVIGLMSPYKRGSNCVGTFWDADNKKIVTLNLGLVRGQIIQKFRVVPLAVEQTNLSRGEGTTSNYEKRKNEHCAERSEHSAQVLSFESGSYVIPGQSLTDEKNAN